MPVHKFNYQVITQYKSILRALGHRSHASLSIRKLRNLNIIRLDQRIETPSKKQEDLKSGAEHCMLKIGRQNNVVQWKEERGMWPVRYDRHVLQHQQEIRPSVPLRGGLQPHLSNGGYRYSDSGRKTKMNP